ncbi:phytochelatin synthase family protein [Polyangium sorediatum]|uniref:glutathione gamma-glutamylcysteinyltransferase n=1 Tax=Polyangium sorediatum TaxID=889274 RepID=A0ABT6P4S4_9BACT|nr:phytochelatin synthase family protein [Polyangium sorediatum]MDI1435534.1 phytochelatin synthase family protein [Polyangium sorediatum]
MIESPKSSKDLERISMVEFQQPIRCCNVTALAYGLTVLGFPTAIDDIFYATRLPVSSVLDDGMTLAETYDTALRLMRTSKLPVSVRVVHFDRPEATLSWFKNEMARAASDPQDIHLLNFNVNIAHDTALGGGHFALLADYDADTGELTVGDVNPRKYTRFWKCPVERMYKACVDKDSASDRSRGLLVLRKEQA